MSNGFANGKALLIGIGQGYPGHLALPRVVRADAEEISRVLSDPVLCGYLSQNVQVLLDEQATRENILDGLDRLATTAQSEDTVFVFFSGHGGYQIDASDAGGYLCPVDFDSLDLQGTGISADELTARIAAINAARIVVALDACHADGAVFIKGEDAGKGLRLGFRDAALDKLASGAGRVVISACRQDETSRTHVASGHSLFTYYLLEGLLGKAVDRGDGFVRVLDLFHYVSEEVPKQATRDHVQHPVLKVHAENNFPLTLRKGGLLKGVGASETGAVLGTAVGPLESAQLENVLCQLYPSGPGHDEIWSRAGGDMSTLRLSGNGRASWHSAIRALKQGGGGQAISVGSLVQSALLDYPGNSDLLVLATQH